MDPADCHSARVSYKPCSTLLVSTASGIFAFVTPPQVGCLGGEACGVGRFDDTTGARKTLDSEARCVGDAQQVSTDLTRSVLSCRVK